MCSENKFKQIFNTSKIKPQQQAQKFHSLLSLGLSHHVEQIDFITRVPLKYSRDAHGLRVESEKYNDLTYHYLPILRLSGLRYLSNLILSFLIAVQWSFKTRKSERAIICDVLNVSISIPAILVGKILRIKTLGIVTDLPESFLKDYSGDRFLGKTKRRLIRKLNESFIWAFDYYVLLTEQMNSKVNPHRNPYIVMEGIIDDSMKVIDNSFHDKYKEKVILYAGGLYLKYGIGRLLEAFHMIEDNDARLWLFGDGDAIDKINEVIQKDSRISYFGIKPNSLVVAEELKSLLLVNPRPTNEEYTQYSFPSKNMEYMVSGTPVVTTKLSGMPQEYLEYVYVFEDESVQGMANKLCLLMQMDRAQLHERGLSAKTFVVNHKNNISQAHRVTSLLFGQHQAP